MIKTLTVFNFFRSVHNGLFTLKHPRFSCVPGFLIFWRSTFFVTARKPRWIQKYIVLKLRATANSAPTTSSGDQVCCNLDSIKAAN